MTMQKVMKSCIIPVMLPDIFQMEISRSLEEKTPRLRSVGFRIELSEVEEVIRRYEGIKDATIVAFDDPNGGGKYIAAYVVSDGQVDINKLNDFIKRKPTSIHGSGRLPLQIDKIPLKP